MPTQPMRKSIGAIQNKRLSMVLTQGSQPANTPGRTQFINKK